MPKKPRSRIKNLGQYAVHRKPTKNGAKPRKNEKTKGSESPQHSPVQVPSVYTCLQAAQTDLLHHLPLNQSLPPIATKNSDEARPISPNSTQNTSEDEKENDIWEEDEENSNLHTVGSLDNDFEDEEEDSSKENDPPPSFRKHVFPPTLDEAYQAFRDIGDILKPHRNDGQGFRDPPFDRIIQEQFEQMKHLCYTFWTMQKDDPDSPKWMHASLTTAKYYQKGPYLARRLCSQVHSFIENPEYVPEHLQKGSAGRSAIDDEDFAQELHLYLQGVGEYCVLDDVVKYVARPEVLERLGRTHTISKQTAFKWMKKMGYQWAERLRGQYVDGHERSDVVHYRNHIFLPAMKELEPSLRKWMRDGTEEVEEHGTAMRVVLWYQDESVFYAHDRHKKIWTHKSSTAKPYAKGEGYSLMVSDFVSADYGWLRSPDGNESAQVLFRVGKNRDGYFDNENIRDQAHRAMDILEKYFSHEKHILVFDNATTHQKRADHAISASKMTKGPSDNFFIQVPIKDTITKKPYYGSDGKRLKKKERMSNGRFQDGTEQAFYFPEGHELAGQFKGMVKILEERGYDVTRKKAQCGRNMSSCPEGRVDCCCRRMLYNEPDFVGVVSALEEECSARGFTSLFLPKFHYELNFIEQCWGYAKCCYWTYPTSSREDVLQKNVVTSLDEVPLLAMRRFSTRSSQFMDAYWQGLNGRQAAWAAKKFQGHRTIPESLLHDYDAELHQLA